MRKMRGAAVRMLALLLVAGMVCVSCSSGNNMYKHRKSDCDCPTF